MTYSAMRDFGVREVVPASEMDIIRENIEHIHQVPEYVFLVTVLSPVSITSSTWAGITGMDSTFTSTGGLVEVQYQVPVATSTVSGYLALTLYLDGVNIGNASVGLATYNSNTGAQILTVRALARPDAGLHTVSLFARVTAGTWVVGNSASAAVRTVRPL